MRISYRKYGYKEYYVNDTLIKRLYSMYVQKKFIEKALNIMVLFAMILTIMGAVLNYLIGVEKSVLIFINGISVFVLFIFVLELLRDYAKAKTRGDFFRKHWIDFTLIMFLSFYFLFVSMFYFFQLWILDSLRPFIQEFKETRILYKFFKK